MSEIFSLIIYLTIAILSTIFFAMHKNKNKIIRYLGIIMAIVIPSVFAGIRYNVGTDYQNYYWTFEQIRNTETKELLSKENTFNMDKGFVMITKPLSKIFDNRALFGIWGAIIISIIIYSLLKKYRTYNVTFIYFAFLLLYYFFSFNILRQVIALSIIFLAISYVFENKPIKYFVLILIASLIHFSALLAIPIWFLWDHKNNKAIKSIKKWGILTLVLLITIFWQNILQNLAAFNIVPIIKYSGYLAGTDHANMSFIIKLIIVIIMITLRKSIRKDNGAIDLFILMFVIGTIFDFTGYYSSFIKRSAIYYSIVEIILFSRIDLVTTRESRWITRIIVIALIIAYFTISTLILKQGGLIPYGIQ